MATLQRTQVTIRNTPLNTPSPQATKEDHIVTNLAAELDYSDFEVAAVDTVDIQKIPRETARTALKPQPSQKPGPSMMEACIYGNEEACAIRDSWKFSIPVREVSRAEYAALLERNEVVFHG